MLLELGKPGPPNVAIIASTVPIENFAWCTVTRMVDRAQHVDRRLMHVRGDPHDVVG